MLAALLRTCILRLVLLGRGAYGVDEVVVAVPDIGHSGPLATTACVEKHSKKEGEVERVFKFCVLVAGKSDKQKHALDVSA